MRKNLISVTVLVCFIQQIVLVPLFAAADNPQATQLRTTLESVGTGRDTQLEVQLKDDAHVRGYLVEVSEDSFLVADRSGRTSYLISNFDVKKVKAYHMSTSTKVVVAAAAAAAVVIAIIIAQNETEENR